MRKISSWSRSTSAVDLHLLHIWHYEAHFVDYRKLNMIRYSKSSILDSPAQTLVNSVNTEGLMSRGAAKELKLRYPAMYICYKIRCFDEPRLKVGEFYLWRGHDKWVLNFAVRAMRTDRPKLPQIASGLQKFRTSARDMGITSVAFPRLGCELAGLDWRMGVRPVIEQYLSGMDMDIYIHE